MSETGAALPRLAVLASGSGTNLQALLDAMADGRLPATPAVVIVNRRAAYALQRAAEASVPTVYFPFAPYRPVGRAAYDTALAQVVAAFEPDLVVLAGWMYILSAAFLDRFPGRVINLHPALPGQFPGTNAIERSFNAFQRGEIAVAGCMVHQAIPEVDAGPVIATAEVPIMPNDTLEEFEARLHAAEHELIVRATALALENI